MNDDVLTQEERSHVCRLVIELEEKYGLKKAAQILTMASMAAATVAEFENVKSQVK